MSLTDRGGNDKRLRVVHLLLTMDVGGLERVAMDLCRATDPGRFDCRIVCARSLGALASVAESSGVGVKALDARGWANGVIRLAQELRRHRPQILHTHNPGAHRVGVPAHLLSRTPVLVHTKHGRNSPDNPRAVAMNRRLARFSDVIVAVSHDAAKVATEIERIPPAKVRVIHNGIDIGEQIPFQAWDDWRPKAITVARLDPVKNQCVMLAATKRVAAVHPDFHLVIVGDGPERENLKTQTKALGLEANVSFLGYRSDVSSLLRQPQIFLLSSISEGIPLTLLEAMAAGLPAIVSDVGGNREVVQDGVTGFLVPSRDPGALSSRLLQLLEDPATLRSMGAAARARAEFAFDLRQCARRYAALYQERLGARI